MSFKKVLLEAHNLNNPATGFGTFTFDLINSFSKQLTNDMEIILNVGNVRNSKINFGNQFRYKQYFSFERYPLFYSRKKHDLWHSLNQNTKIEPHNSSEYVLTVHDVNFHEEISSDMNHKCNKLFMKKLERATTITYISEYAKKQTHQYFDIPKIDEFIIYNGNPVVDYLNTSGCINLYSPKKPFLYTIGDFTEKKNYQSIIKMMLFNDDFNLIISGNNNKPHGVKIQTLINDLKLDKKVFLTGKVTNQQKHFYLKNCTAFVFPSIREGFGLPPIEAMKYKKPVFLSTLTSLPEIGSDAAFYWENFDPEEMNSKLNNGLNHFELNKEEMENKLKNRADFFDWDKSASEYMKVYRKLLY